jgi:hypothetical protein
LDYVQHKIPCLCPVRLDLASRLNIEASHDDACFGTVTTLAPALGNTMTFNLEIELCLFFAMRLGSYILLVFRHFIPAAWLASVVAFFAMTAHMFLH